jgi:hypothetical protein
MENKIAAKVEAGILECDGCGKKFNEAVQKTERAEYEGGRAWTFYSSPCCRDSYHEVGEVI